MIGPVSIASGQELVCQRGDLPSGVVEGVILACPRQDGPSLIDEGLEFKVRILRPNGTPISGIPATDIWLRSNESICGGRILIPNGPTDQYGITSFVGSLRAGGCEESQMYIMVRRNGRDLILVENPATCTPPVRVPVRVVSPDIDADGDVDSVDREKFDDIYYSGSYHECADYNGDGSVDNEDLLIFEQHMGHVCS